MSHKKQKKVLKEFYQHYPQYLTDEYAVKIIKYKLKCIKKAMKQGKDYTEYLADVHNMSEKLYKELKGL